MNWRDAWAAFGPGLRSCAVAVVATVVILPLYLSWRL